MNAATFLNEHLLDMAENSINCPAAAWAMRSHAITDEAAQAAWEDIHAFLGMWRDLDDGVRTHQECYGEDAGYPSGVTPTEGAMDRAWGSADEALHEFLHGNARKARAAGAA